MVIECLKKLFLKTFAQNMIWNCNWNPIMLQVNVEDGAIGQRQQR